MNEPNEWIGFVRMLFYPVIFVSYPVQAADHVLEQIVKGSLHTHSPECYLGAVEAALASDCELADLISISNYSEAAIRWFLSAIAEGLSPGSASSR